MSKVKKTKLIIEEDHTIQFLNKWKELIEEGEEPLDIHIPGYGTFINCTVTPEFNGYTVKYDEYKEE